MMRFSFKAVLAVTLLSTCAPAFAQEIVVTASRRSGSGPATSPPIIVLKRTADFAVLSVEITGDTRDEAKRHQEIFDMVRSAIERAPKYNVELSVGTYVIEPLTLGNYRSLTLADGNRDDTDKVSFLVKARLTQGMDAKDALDRITRFVKELPAVGRALIERDGDLSLSVVNPNQYRTQIIDLIAADAQASATKFGTGYGVQVTGLDRPVEWGRASLTEVMLYLPSAYTVVPRN